MLPALFEHMVPATVKMTQRVVQASAMIREIVDAIDQVKDSKKEPSNDAIV